MHAGLTSALFALTPSPRRSRALIVLAGLLAAAGATWSTRADARKADHQHGAAPAASRDGSGASAPSNEPVPPVPQPQEAAAKGVVTPSWFPGGEGLYAPPYYESFPGIDLAVLTPVQKERFLHWVNTEFCACGQSGCSRDTIANCYLNDRTCPWAPVRIRKIYDAVRSGATLPWAPHAALAPSR